MDEMAQTAGLAGKAGNAQLSKVWKSRTRSKASDREQQRRSISEMGVQIFEDYVGKYLADRVIRVIIFSIFYGILCVSSHSYRMAEPALPPADHIWTQ